MADIDRTLPLIVLLDDEIDIVNALMRVLRPVAAKIEAFTCPFTALDYCNKHSPQLIISDQHMLSMLGCEFPAGISEK